MSGERQGKDGRHQGRKKSGRRIWILVLLVLLAVLTVCFAAERISVGNGKADGYSEETASGEAKTESTMEGSIELKEAEKDSADTGTETGMEDSEDTATETGIREAEETATEAGTGGSGETDTESEDAGTEPGKAGTEPEEAVNSETGSVEEQAAELVSSLTLTEQIYQMFIVRPEQLTGVSVQTQAGSTTKQALSEYPVGGIVLFADNIQTREQVQSMIAGFQSYSSLGLFIAVDEEGGSVARVGKNSSMGTTAFPDMKEIGDSGDTNEAYQVGSVIGSEIAELGFNLDFAPVADVDSNPDNPVIGDRSFSSDADVAAAMVTAAVEGFRDSGMLCTLKHFPGHGDTATDSHEGYTELDKSLEELWEVELVPFQAGIAAGAEFVMVGHISVPQVTGDDTPASLSGTMLDILREDLSFDGLIITDSMQMEAITDRYSSGEAAVLAVQAGVDVILMPGNLQEAVNGILDAVQQGRITEERIAESAERILATKLRAGIL